MSDVTWLPVLGFFVAGLLLGGLSGVVVMAVLVVGRTPDD